MKRHAKNDHVNATITKLEELCEKYVNVNKNFVDASITKNYRNNVDGYFRTIRSIGEVYCNWQEKHLHESASRIDAILKRYRRF